MWEHPNRVAKADARSDTGTVEDKGVINLEGTSRLSKIIAMTGLASRREAETMIREERVSVNGSVINSVSHIVNPVLDTIMVDGKRLPQNKGSSTQNLHPLDRPRLWVAHKLSGELVSAQDIKNRPLLLDRIKKQLNLDFKTSLKPIEHLEYRTEGLCLLSNNGSLSRYLGSVKANLDRAYRIRIHGLLTESKIKAIRYGPMINGTKHKGMDIVIDRQGKSTISWITLTTRDVTVRSIRAVLDHLHIKTLRVMCVRVGPFKLDTIPAGSVQEIKIPMPLLSAWQAS